MNKRELATVLAALRHWQSIESTRWGREVSIATDGGSLAALDDAEIDALCQKLNLAAKPATSAAIVVEGGSVRDIVTDGSLKIAVIDYDAREADPCDRALVPQGPGARPAPAVCSRRIPEVQPARAKELLGVASKAEKARLSQSASPSR